jgi:putative SOS response-associated peptidase YedK
MKEMQVKRLINPYTPNYNASPGQNIPAVYVEDGEVALDVFRWGLIPHWAKDAKIGMKMVNARVETVAEKPAFRKALQYSRCLIIADGFFEWKKEGSAKIPHYIRLTDRDYFTFAGLYEKWKDPEGGTVKSATIITVQPNSLMAKIHDRMPAILRKRDEKTWISQEDIDNETLLSALRPHEASEMKAVEVSTFVNSPENNSPKCIDPVKTLKTNLAEFW